MSPEGGSKKRKEVTTLKLTVMFAKQQVVSDLNKTRDTCNTQFQEGNKIGLECQR